MKSVLSRFSKGVKNSRALSFGVSMIHNCDDVCRQKQSAECYALSPERQYSSYKSKLIRHKRISPSNLVYRALNELMAMRQPPVWFRFSISSSLPKRNSLSNKEWGLFRAALEDFANYCKRHNIKVHIPVESYNKARTYRSIFEEFGICVRRSIQDERWERSLLKSADSVSYVVEKNQDSSEIMKACRESGLTVVNCPAIRGVSKFGKSKCGICKACSRSEVNVVLYEKH